MEKADKNILFSIPNENKILKTFELDVDWSDFENYESLANDSDTLVYRSPLKLEWLKEQEKRYGKVGEI